MDKPTVEILEQPKANSLRYGEQQKVPRVFCFKIQIPGFIKIKLYSGYGSVSEFASGSGSKLGHCSGSRSNINVFGFTTSTLPVTI